MTPALWAALAAVAALWPARLVGPLDGIPLDTPLEAVALGVVATSLIVFEPSALKRPMFRAVVVALLIWKAATSATLTQDGWCLRYTTPHPVFRDMGLVPHSWDLRADWRSFEPACSAVMARAFSSIERFPVWFFNLPPADPLETPTEADRPPYATLRLDLAGFVTAADSGVLRVSFGDDMRVEALIDDSAVEAGALAGGVTLAPGLHRVVIASPLSGSEWKLVPTWNDAPLWNAVTATLAPPAGFEAWIRPWGRYVPAVLLAILIGVALSQFARRVGVIGFAYPTLTGGVAAAIAAMGRPTLTRAVPLLLAGAAAVPWPRRLTNLVGFRVLIAVPFLAVLVILALPQVGVATWYTGGDDWWMFQRFAYRIVFQGYWLQGGEPAFWFQPLYRWIAGGLHVVFGDSSVGEFFWDGACLLTGACFAFHIARAFAGFRWGIIASVLTLAVFVIGPGWYLIGRGLSEITSAGFIYGAALLALRARAGFWPAAFAAGALATLGFLARLNNLPMVLAVAAFALPVRAPAGHLWNLAAWPRLSRPVLAGVLGGVSVGLWLFTWRTWYYTGVPSMLFGTQAGTLSVWQTTDDGQGPMQHVLDSFLMVLAMTDPPRFDVRALPVVIGVVAAALAVMRVPPFRLLPLNAAGLCLSAIAGALVARGTAYPGRFSIHLIPVTVALAVCAVSLVKRRRPEGARV